ncbi:MAG: tRNA pseudouridine(13) synthase TruD [Desulfurococcaceae archaeon TW002]
MVISVSSNYLDVSVGMLVFSRPELRLSEKARFSKKSDSFKVYEVGIDGTLARPLSIVGEDIVCEESKILRYVMCKEDIPTPDAIKIVSRLLSVKVSYAGIKDAEGFTCQFITFKCRLGRKFSKFYEFLNGKITLFFQDFVDSMLGRSHLEGNYFEVLLKDLSKTDLELLHKLRNSYGKITFLNYYGYQRFGVRRPITHLIGKALLENNIEKALDLIVGNPYPTESQKVIEARKSYEKGDLKEALKLFPRSFSVERSLIKGLLRGMSTREVLSLIDEWLMRMYVEAYQSYLFNLALSKLTIQLGDADVLARKCDVIPLPRPNLSLIDECTRESIKTVEEELKLIDTESKYAEYLSRSSREVVFILQDFTYEEVNDEVLLRFFLKPSTYATVFLRELLGPPKLF